MTTAEADSLLSEVRADGLLLVTINRPSKRNALHQDTLQLLGQTFAGYATDPRVKLAVLTGTGDKSFAAGGDLRELATIKSQEGAADMSRRNRDVFDQIRRFPLPVIAAINGDALGGGAELAAACDMRIAAERARIGFIHGRLGLTTAWGGIFDLAALVGPSRAMSLLCRGDVLSARDAFAIGLVNEVVDAAQSLDDAVIAYCRPMLSKPRHVLAAFKALMLKMRGTDTRAELCALETKLFAEAWIDDAHWKAAETALTGGGG